MDEEDIKVMARALCLMSLTLIINLVFLHLIIYASPVSIIRVFDHIDRGASVVSGYIML